MTFTFENGEMKSYLINYGKLIKYDKLIINDNSIYTQLYIINEENNKSSILDKLKKSLDNDNMYYFILFVNYNLQQINDKKKILNKNIIINKYNDIYAYGLMFLLIKIYDLGRDILLLLILDIKNINFDIIKILILIYLYENNKDNCLKYLKKNKKLLQIFTNENKEFIKYLNNINKVIDKIYTENDKTDIEINFLYVDMKKYNHEKSKIVYIKNYNELYCFLKKKQIKKNSNPLNNNSINEYIISQKNINLIKNIDFDNIINILNNI